MSTTILLDGNVWRYLADGDAGEQLARVASLHETRIKIAPSVLYEAMRTKDQKLRKRLVELMTRRCWTRAMPEAYCESMEFVSEVRRLRPEWLLTRTRRIQVRNVFLDDWKRVSGGFWDRARNDTDGESERIMELDQDTLQRALHHTEQFHASAVEAGWRFEKIDLNKITARLSRPTAGWKGDDIAAWRVPALTSFTYAISQEDHAFIDWVAPMVDLTKARSSKHSWNRFWFYDIEAPRMQRFWLRWALEVLQGLRKLTNGAPCDAQLGTYLVECDRFASADKALVAMLQKCRESAPFPFGEPLRISAGPKCINDLFQLISERSLSPSS
jgi:hypothetical protein